MKRRHLFRWAVAGPLAVLLALMAVVHPYLAITERSGGDVLVVEGWMEEPELRTAFALASDPTYRHIYTTGTIRPFSYYLRDREGLRVQADSPLAGMVRINVSGTGNAGFTLLADGDTVLHRPVAPQGQVFEAAMPRPARVLELLSWNTASNDGRQANIFILHFRVDGANVHALKADIRFLRRDGHQEPAWPTYAERARGLFVEFGMPHERITAVPASGRPGRRTWSNATGFAARASADHVEAFDIATVGVHARRSRAMYRKACDPAVSVGVISIPDPYCLPGNWWRSWRGFATLLKEIIGMSGGQGVEQG